VLLLRIIFATFGGPGKILGEGATLQRWVGKCVGCDGDDLDLFPHLGDMGVLLHIIWSGMVPD
jgi:hypothetical protein